MSRMQGEESPYLFLRKSISEHEEPEFSAHMGVKQSTTQKWWREPASDENPNASGRTNFIAYCDRFFDWLLLRYPARAVLFVQRYADRLHQFRLRQAPPQPLTEAELRIQLGLTFKENSDVMVAVVEGAPLVKIKTEYAEFRNQIENLILRLEITESSASAARRQS